MFSMCSELTPRACILDTRIPQFMQPCYPVVIAPLYKWTPLSYMPSKRLCKVCMSTETLANKIQRIMALVTDISPMFLSSLPLVKSIFHWAEPHRSSQLNSSQWHSNAILKICCPAIDIILPERYFSRL